MGRGRSLLRAASGLVIGFVASTAHADVNACLDAAESGQALRANSQLLEAKQSFIACAAASCPKAVRADCTGWLAQIDAALPSIIVRAHDEGGRDIQNGTLSIDGRSAALDGRPVFLNPGKHVLRAEAPLHGVAEEPIVVRQSERDRIVSIALAHTKPVADPALRPAVAPPVDPPIPVASWVLWAAGAAAIGTGVSFGLIGSGEHADLEGSCARTSSCAGDDVAAARTKLIVGDVLVSAGVIAVGVGLYFAFTRGTRASSMTPAALRF